MEFKADPKNGKAKIGIPVSELDKMSRVTEAIEEENLEFTIKSNSLKESFLKMGEKEFHTSSTELEEL